MESIFKVSGVVDISVYDELTGEVKQSETRHITNKVVTNGADFIASRMIGTTYPSVAAGTGWMAVGTSSTAANIGDLAITATGLTGGNTAVISTATQGTYGGGTINQITFVTTFAAGVATGPITEAGILNFNGSTGVQTGTNRLLARTVFSTVNKGASDAMSITWTITIAVA